LKDGGSRGENKLVKSSVHCIRGKI